MPKKLYLTEAEKRERQLIAMRKYRERLKEKYGDDYWAKYQKKRYYIKKYNIEEKQIANKGLQVVKKKTLISWD